MFTISGPVILDLNSQRDLLAPDGLYPVFQADKLIDPYKKLFVFAQRNRVPVISTRFHTLTTPGQRDAATRHPILNPAPKVICHPRSSGYAKLPFTNLRQRREFPLDCGTDLPVDGFRTLQQFVFDLPSLNLFESPRLDRLLSESSVELFLIAGIPLEWTVRTAVLGLLARRHKVAVISDCLGMWDPYEGDMALRQIESKNIEWFTIAQVEERFNLVARLRASRAAARAKSRFSYPTAPLKPSAAKLPDRPGQSSRRSFRL